MSQRRSCGTCAEEIATNDAASLSPRPGSQRWLQLPAPRSIPRLLLSLLMLLRVARPLCPCPCPCLSAPLRLPQPAPEPGLAGHVPRHAPNGVAAVPAGGWLGPLRVLRDGRGSHGAGRSGGLLFLVLRLLPLQVLRAARHGLLGAQGQGRGAQTQQGGTGLSTLRSRGSAWLHAFQLG